MSSPTAASSPRTSTREEAEKRIVKAIGKGLMKTISKMGISTIQSYCGAQIFEAVGLEPELIDKHFTGTASRIGGVGLEQLAQEALERHFRAYPRTDREVLPVGGVLQWRRNGERHVWNPDTIATIQHAVQGSNGDPRETYAEYARMANEESVRHALLRGLMKLQPAGEPVPLADVEPAASIVKRFTTGAMSLGALGREAHETLAIAMNRLGARSNTGEGGEDPSRYMHDPNGDLRRSAIKQVASGRFGVTVHYLVNADQLQIKMAQGAKPGEGGQLPGHKVDEYIAWLRSSTPGVGLISPPPHHDIYSIEDLKQLIYDLRCANPTGSVSVKLVSEVGVGTVAAGVAKANADHVTIAGHDGGTGASPQSSIQGAGVPWEIGLAETQQTLLLNDLRTRIVVEVDGGMRTGRDVVVAALLGADEFGFSTAPLIAMGCIMMRVCHLNTCPVGIASQDPELRKRFRGTPEQVVNYMMLVAEDVRSIMASLGVRRFEDMIGRTEMLDMDEALEHWKASRVDLSMVLSSPDLPPGTARRRTRPQQPVLDDALDWELVRRCNPALEHGEDVRLGPIPVRNVNRTVGGILSGEIARRHGAAGLPEGTIEIAFTGSAGQSFAAWLAPGVIFSLRGETNDYAGKGLSGGVVSVRPPEKHRFRAEENMIVGNTVLYGATAGRAFFRGLGRRALRGPEFGGVCGCRRSRRPRLRVHDRRPRGRARAHGPELRRRHERRDRLRVRRRPALRGAVQSGAGRPGGARRRRRDPGARADLRARRAHRFAGRSQRARVMGSRCPRALRQGDAARLQAGPRRSGGCGTRRDGRARRARVMGELGAFLKIHRVGFDKRDPEQRVHDYKQYFGLQPESELQRQGARCMDCGIPFCHEGCPLGNLIPDWNDLVYRGKWREAIDQLHATNNFPEFTGRICPAPCESACVLAINDDPVTIEQIEMAIAERAFEEGWVVPEPPDRRTGKRWR